MRKKAYYHSSWVDVIWQEFLGAYTRATEITLDVLGLYPEDAKRFLQENSNLWQIFKDVVHKVDVIAYVLGEADLHRWIEQTTTHLYSGFSLKRVIDDPELTVLLLTGLRDASTIKEREILGGCSQAKRSGAKKNRPYSRPKEYYIR